MSEETVFEIPADEPEAVSQEAIEEPKKKQVKSGRKPMSETDKQALIRRLKEGRERKAKERAEKAKQGIEEEQKVKSNKAKANTSSPLARSSFAGLYVEGLSLALLPRNGPTLSIWSRVHVGPS